ncbi:MAG: carboxypeptidase regulatory-like domain-containing protein [Bacteroidales bacterium]|nr:carboxypeptidase regulatory-like domain-containing protein [Bacteroidales bacterium]
MTSAQPSAFTIVGQPLATLPVAPQGLYLCDSALMCNAAGLPMLAMREGVQVVGYTIDTALARFSANIEWTQRNPSTGELYVVVRNKKGVPKLYNAIDKGKRRKLKEVHLAGFEDKMVAIESPVFTTDGSLMIFSSNHPKGQGGYDLWYSELKQGQWQRPQNMGTRINTASDEVTPFIYRSYLIFASRGHYKNHSDLNLYATCLLSDQVVGDTVGMLQIGRNRIQRLPEPLNSDNDNFALVVDTLTEFAYWLRTEGATTTVASFKGPLQGTNLWGQVTNKNGQPVSGVAIKAMQDGHTVCHTETNLFGYYQLYLLNGRQYTIQFSKPNHYLTSEAIATQADNGDALLTDQHLDAVMDSLPLNEQLMFDDLFDYDASPELSAHGKAVLQPLIRFLRDNPSLQATMTLYGEASNSPDFDQLVAQNRLQQLEAYLFANLAPTTKIGLKNSSELLQNYAPKAIKSRLVVILRAEK